MLLVILSAILGILAFPPIGIYPLGFVFLVPLFIFFLKEKNFIKLLWGTFLFRFLLGIGIVFFAFEPLIFLSSILIFLGLPLSFFALRSGLMRINTRINADKVILILLPFLWTFWDFIEAQYSLLPVFVATAGNIFGSSPFLGLATIGGLVGLTFFAVLVNTLFTLIILQFLGSRTSKNYVILGSSTSLLLILIFSGWLISQIQLQKNEVLYQKLTTKIKIALISNNKNFDEELEFFEHDILSPEEKIIAETIIEKKLNLIKNELYGQKIDLIILPEDMIDVENTDILIGVYRRLAQEFNANLAATLTTIQNNKRYNSTILFNQKGELVDIYNKSSLTILGEYWPFGDWRPFYYTLIRNMMPKIDAGWAVFNKEYAYQPGQMKILKTDPSASSRLIFGSAICSEIQYPRQIKEFKKMGAKFISHTTTNRWVTIGLNNFRELTNNLRKIEAVWLKMPILINGRQEMAGLITPDGQMDLVNFESLDKDFGIFIGEIKF